MYSLEVSLIILGMVLTGTARSVGVKVFYQLGAEDNPLFVALLYLFGQSLALLVYGASRLFANAESEKPHEYSPVLADADEDDPRGNGTVVSSDASTDDEDEDDIELQPVVSPEAPNTEEEEEEKKAGGASVAPPPRRQRRLRRQGSGTGLTEESRKAVAWIHSIPWYAKPLIPGLFNLANAAFKWASFVFVAASVAEMLMSGLELVLSTLVARLVRKRTIHPMRWAGVLIVAVGLAVVHASSLGKAPGDADDDSSVRREHWIGGLLIVGQCVTAVGQDIAEEIFLQEADFPATLLLGMEGLLGLVVGLPLYNRFAPETPSETLSSLHGWQGPYVVFLLLVFTTTGIFNIWTTGVTSSMTRNMWKNCRTLLVWMVGLLLYYSLGNENLGEAWVLPDSFWVLGGFLVMLSGIYVYYKHK